MHKKNIAIEPKKRVRVSSRKAEAQRKFALEINKKTGVVVAVIRKAKPKRETIEHFVARIGLFVEAFERGPGRNQELINAQLWKEFAKGKPRYYRSLADKYGVTVSHVTNEWSKFRRKQTR